jgi:hypothetical protein
MEAAALEDFLNWAQSMNILAKISATCCDKDSSMHKLLLEDERFVYCSLFYWNLIIRCKHIELTFDPGHVKKSFEGSLRKLFGKSKVYQLFASRIANWFMRAICEAKSRFPNQRSLIESEFRRRMSYLIPHYTNVCSKACPCQVPPLVDATEVSSDVDHWLSPILGKVLFYCDLDDTDVANFSLVSHKWQTLVQDGLSALECRKRKATLSVNDPLIPQLRELVCRVLFSCPHSQLRLNTFFLMPNRIAMNGIRV